MTAHFGRKTERCCFNRRQRTTAASNWFEIWGVVDPGLKKIRFFHANFRQISIFSGNFTKVSIFSNLKISRFSRQKLAIYSYFWANYYISLQKSPLSNILPVHDKT